MSNEYKDWLKDIPPDGDYLESENRYVTGSGQILNGIHARGDCIGKHCVIHNPSDHHMRGWPTHWRYDRYMFERICPHGIGHPDPDDPTIDTIHGCDGCCTPPEDK